MEKPKVAMMTWYSYKNYGTVLQASALYHTLRKMGCAPSLIQYYPKQGAIEKKSIDIRYLFSAVNRKLRNMGDSQYISSDRDRLFDAFLRARTSQTDICRSHAELWELNEKFDAFVCGSDQIWSPLGCNEKYYLSFVDNSEKMIAYAPSMGVQEIKNQFAREIISKNLLRFKHLSVRETRGAKIVEELTGQRAEVVLDPTLLLTSDEWDTFADVEKAPGLPENEYMLCYFLGESEKYMRYVQKLAAELQLRVYVIPITQKQKQSPRAVPFEVGPGEFVSLVRNAKYVCTDSFHCVAFSINYNIPFSAFSRFSEKDPRNQNTRIESLLNLLGLSSRLVDYRNCRFEESVFTIDYGDANLRLAEQRKVSVAYLERSLAQAVQAKEADAQQPYKITDTCCGCGACAVVCPQNAIHISRNDMGFQHYGIDTEKCVRCGKCRTVCPMAYVTAMEMEKTLGLYSVRSISEQVLLHSSSGGMGYELVRILQQEGRYICGCAYDPEGNCARHMIVAPDEEDKALMLQGSKYIQSVTAEAVLMITELAGKSPVAFFGTPCQIAAVDKLLRRKKLRENAVLVDLICHGVPSYYLWSKHLRSTRKKHHTGTNPSVVFRYNGAGWHCRQMRIEGNGNIYMKNERKDDFYAFFRRSLCNMEACYDCPYRERTAADLRIGDYWGKRFAAEKQGVSMVIANTYVGQRLMTSLKEQGRISVQEQDVREYWTVQYPYNIAKPLFHAQLIEELRNDSEDLHALRKEYCQYYDFQEGTVKMRQFVKRMLK